MIGAGINTTFEQFKNLYATLGLNVNYDDLRTDDPASTSLKNIVVHFLNFQEYMHSPMTKEIDPLCLQMDL